jgi:hypothetical protein
VGLGLVLALSLASAPAAAECSGGFDQEHSAWTALLKQYVSGGSVNYNGLHSGGKAALQSYLGSLEGVCREEYGGWNNRQKLSFWINAYNAYTVKLIVDNYPTKSIMKIGGREGAAFDQRFIPLQRLEGKQLSLNDLENKIIRPRFRENRVHFALNCASKSCPPMRPEAYTATALDRQLGAQARAFIRDSKMNRYDAATHTLHLSHIFEWYGEDFQRGDSTVASFVGRYLGGDAEAAITAKAPAIDYLDYDWSLNGR